MKSDSTWAGRLGYGLLGMIGLGAVLAWLAEFLGPDWGPLVWLAGLLMIVGGVALALAWVALWVAVQTIRANRPSRHPGPRRGRRPPRSGAALPPH